MLQEYGLIIVAVVTISAVVGAILLERWLNKKGGGKNEMR